MGGWGKHHARVLHELSALSAVCDINEERARLYGNMYRVHTYTNVDRLLQERVADAVTICTPTSTHFELASKVIERGLPTFIEKPLTRTSKEGEVLTEMAERKGVLVTVGYIERFNPAVQQAKELIQSGQLGEPLLLEFHREHRWRGNIIDTGIVADTAVHDIDTARWLFDEEPRVAYARTGRVLGQHEDFAAILLGFREQRTAFITANWVTPKRVRVLTAVCSGGVINLDFINQDIRVDTEGGITIPRREHQEPLLLELRSFIECTERGTKPLVTGRDGVVNTKIAEAALLSSRTGVPVYLGL